MGVSPAARLLRRMFAGAALVLLAACHPASAAQSQCVPPAPWPAPAARPGRSSAELAACLKAQAWETRNLAIPAQSAVAGIIAQCEIRVDRLEGGVPADQETRETAAQRIATAAVAQYRQCAGK